MTSDAAALISSLISNVWSAMTSFNLPGTTFSAGTFLIGVCFAVIVFKVCQVILRVFSGGVARAAHASYRSGGKSHARISDERSGDEK